MYFFSRDELNKVAEEYASAFTNAEPFPHVVIDDFLPLEVATTIGSTFPNVNQIDWRLAGPGDTKHTHDSKVEKITTSNEENFPEYIRHMMYSFQSGVFLRFMERITEFSDLNPDPYHHGCGLHSTGNGGRLMLHLDASRHPNKDFHQLVNLIYYCTPGWKEEYGGHLELWDKKANRCEKRIAPLFNRVVIFYTGKHSFHGHPQPITCPDGMRRNSLALYYYTTKKEQSDLDYTNFVEWKAVTEHDKREPHHYAKLLLRRSLPTPLINELATFVRRKFPK